MFCAQCDLSVLLDAKFKNFILLDVMVVKILCGTQISRSTPKTWFQRTLKMSKFVFYLILNDITIRRIELFEL